VNISPRGMGETQMAGLLAEVYLWGVLFLRKENSYQYQSRETFTAPSCYVIGIYRIDGAYVVDIPVTGKCRMNSVVWDGRTILW